MRRCIIHVGHPKTASTYLQHCLHLNTALFARHNYWVPGEFSAFGAYDLEPLSQQGKIISGNLAPWHELKMVGPGAQIPAMENYLFAAHAMPPGCDIVLSSELMFYYVRATLEIVHRAREFGFQPELIAYLPRQDHAAISAYLQNVRFHGFSAGVVDFLAHDPNIAYCCYLPTLKRLTDVEPDLPITLRTFDRQFLAAGDVFTDFLETTHSRVDPADCIRPARASNPGLLLEHYELLRVANILNDTAAAHRLRDADIRLTQADRARLAAYYYRPGVATYLTRTHAQDNVTMLSQFMRDASGEEQSYWRNFDPVANPVSLDQATLARLRNEVEMQI